MYKMLLFAKILGISPLLNIDIEQESKLVNMYRGIGSVYSLLLLVYRTYTGCILRIGWDRTKAETIPSVWADAV